MPIGKNEKEKNKKIVKDFYLSQKHMEDFSKLPDRTLAKSILINKVFRDLDMGGLTYGRSRIGNIEIAARRLLGEETIPRSKELEIYIRKRIIELGQVFQEEITNEQLRRMLWKASIDSIHNARNNDNDFRKRVQEAEQNFAAIYREDKLPQDQIEVTKITNSYLSKLLMMEIIENPEAVSKEMRDDDKYGYSFQLQSGIQTAAALLPGPCVDKKTNDRGNKLLDEYWKRGYGL